MKTFTTGAIAGASSLLLAVPLLAQMAGAASDTTSSTAADALADRPVPSQECVKTMADHEGTMLAGLDTHIAAHKAALTAHHDALAAAATIVDDTARKNAIQKANEAMRTAMEAARPDDATMKAQMEAMHKACGDEFHFGMAMGAPGMMMKFDGGPGGRGHGPRMENLAEKLGMTDDELKAALEAGKTIPQIAEEKGVDLPEPPIHGERDVFFFKSTDSAPAATLDAETSTSSVQ